MIISLTEFTFYLKHVLVKKTKKQKKKQLANNIATIIRGDFTFGL